VKTPETASVRESKMLERAKRLKKELKDHERQYALAKTVGKKQHKEKGKKGKRKFGEARKKKFKRLGAHKHWKPL